MIYVGKWLYGGILHDVKGHNLIYHVTLFGRFFSITRRGDRCPQCR